MVKKIKYMVLKKIGNLEIRKYPPLLLASVSQYDPDAAFRLLFDYISGNNRSRKRIPMTSPVISSERIGMTSPVISTKNYMAFSLPNEYSKETAPIPVSSKIIIEEIPEKIHGVLRFSGRSTKKRIEKYAHLLQDLIEKEELDVSGNFFLLQYNSPFTPGFLRRNEVSIQLKNFDK